MDLSEAMFSLLHTVRNEISQQVKLLNIELSPMHLKSLKVISMIDTCTGQKLAKAMGRDKAQINRLIKELVNQELVIKTENKDDGRSHILNLSPRGTEFITEFNKIENQIFTKMAQGVAADDIDNFIQLAKVFRSNLKQHN